MQTQKLFDNYVIPSVGRFPLSFVEGKGSWLIEENGGKYLDMYPGWGVNIVGHCHPKVVTAIQKQAAKLLHAPNNYLLPLQGQLAEKIIKRSFPGKVFFSNSGAEANEGAMKIARKWGKNKGKWKFVSMLDSFHGRTLGALSATGQEKYRKDFEPLIPGFSYVPFGDIQAVKEIIDDETCAIMVEPIQGEGGVNVAPENYFKELKNICNDRNCLLIFDEVQTGVARTGEWFAYQLYNVKPDIMTLAKALGGGVPIGAIVAAQNVADVLQPGSHASTYGGNPLVCAAGLAVISVIENEKGLEKAKNVEKSLKQNAEKLKQEFNVIRNVRGAGAMLGIELDIPGQSIVKSCLEDNVLVNCTHERVIRFLTSVFISENEIEITFNALHTALSKI
ncbi:MAG: aspartate aminotransferase family protein [Chlamydiae bacterium]|nr:MAG: aspartate aminotransferase family protein [Chlamydiota bacterium]